MRVELRPASFRSGPATANVETTKAAKAPPKSTSVEPADQTGLIEKRASSAISSAPEAQTSGQSAETFDAVLKKAKATTAATLKDPASAEFGDMKRAIRKDLSGQPIDTICGHVKEKKASGEEPEDRPFLYLVKEDRVYIDDGYPESVAATWNRAVCNNPDLYGKDIRQQPSK